MPPSLEGRYIKEDVIQCRGRQSKIEDASMVLEGAILEKGANPGGNQEVKDKFRGGRLLGPTFFLSP